MQESAYNEIRDLVIKLKLIQNPHCNRMEFPSDWTIIPDAHFGASGPLVTVRPLAAELLIDMEGLKVKI